ncbi:hypothetical protein HPP92_021914 [Vanilla planifolia]|uniref:U-box domain-containing protein n=1 Tax=Vanilla planifolia TaxID=51239 RepID=A0A835UHA1_VANPL|nr:hypothetical protein HPP92_021914 [Vanilla planifolia]
MCQNPNPPFGQIDNGPPVPCVPEEQDRVPNRQAQLQELARALANGDVAVRVQAARDIRRIVRASPRARTAFAIPVVIQPLVSMLPSADRSSREAALLALLNLAVRNERNKEKIASNGAIPLLVEILRSDNQLGELATASLLSLSASNSNKPDIASSGAIPLLVKILVSGSIQGRVDAVTALFNLFSCSECGVDLFLPVEAVRPLLSLLKDSRKHSKLADKVTALLEILSESEEGRLAIAEVEGGILTIVETIENGSFVGTEHSVSILHALCWNNRERYRELILNEGPIPGLLLLTVEGTKKARSRAHELLDLLRPDSRPKRVPHEELETIVYDIAKRVDGPQKAAETAKRLMQDMVRRNMEANIDKLEQSAATCNLNSPLS